MNTARFCRLAVPLTIILITSACQLGISLTPAATPNTPATPTPPSLPTRYSEFSNLSNVQQAARFPVWLPAFIPETLPFYKAWVSDYADGSETIRIVYAEPGDPLDANLKAVDVQLTQTDQGLSRDSITHQFKVNALDVREVSVRGQTGFTYWTRSGAAGNSAILVWREGVVKISVALHGDWPQPDENNPHGLDGTLLKIAASLQTTKD